MSYIDGGSVVHILVIQGELAEIEKYWYEENGIVQKRYSVCVQMYLRERKT